MNRLLVRSGVALLILMGEPNRIVAHQTVPDPIVEMFVKADGERLTVQVRLPIAVLADANLPRDGTGLLALDATAEPLQLVGRDIASNLELQQADDLLPDPTIATAIAADAGSVDVVLTYFIRAGAGNISARLRTFRAGAGMVRTIAHYDEPPDPTRTFVVIGDPERISFNPGPLEAVRKFVARGTARLLSDGDFLLFAFCLVLPVRRERALGAACAAFLAGEIAAGLVSGAGVFRATPEALIAVEMVASSAIVVATLQVVTNPRTRWLVALALIFGVAHGPATGAAFLGDSSLAGSHVALALAGFMLVVTLGQMWAVALMSSAAALLFRWGLPERRAALALAILAGHEALHRIADRSASLAAIGRTTPDRILMTLTLAWAGLIVCAGIVEIVFFRRAGDVVAPPIPDREGGSLP